MEGGTIFMDDMPLDDFEEPRGWLGRLKDRLTFGGDEEEEETDPRQNRGKKGGSWRLHSARVSRVSVWHAADNFETARQVADGLKEGHPQVVNLENTSHEMAVRIIDFLNGVIYALDGYVEKVGTKVYFFTPSHTVIDVEDSSPQRRSFFTGN